jgi:chromatin segregation and condensation protein Rec8/ScpA/Scc1 (kleisin family)
LSPIPDLQPPKTPKTPSYTRTPPKKKRKTEDKRQKEKVSAITNHVTEQPSEVLERDLSSIQDIRAGSIQPSDQFQPMLEELEEDDDDYGAPMSVGPPEEMLPDETDDQYEERIRQKRTNILLKFMVNRLEEEGQLLFSNLVRSNRRKQVAQKFFSLLVLKKQQAIELTQDPDVPYAEIVIEKGVRYEEALASSVL